MAFLLRDGTAFADDQFVARIKHRQRLFPHTYVVETKLNRNRCRPSDPELQQANGGTASANNGRAAIRRIAQRLIGRVQYVVAPVDYDPNSRPHSWLEQQILIAHSDDDSTGRDVLDSLGQDTKR
jgi:hypothetical protein